MDVAYIASELARAGVLRQALPDAMRRAHEHFLGLEPSQAEMDAWCTQLRTAASHLFTLRREADEDEDGLTDVPWEIVGVPQEVYERASPAQKLTWARQVETESGEPPTDGREQRRPQPYTATVAQQAEIAALKTPQEQLTRFRAMRDEAQGRG